MKKVYLSGVMLLILTITANAFAVAPQNKPTQKSGNDYLIATIAGEELYFSEVKKLSTRLNRFLKENFETSDKWRQDYIHQYIARVALAKRAEREGVADDASVIFDLKQARLNILSDKLLKQVISKINITEKDYQDYYNNNLSKYTEPARVKISYFKTDNEKKAKNVLEKINKGKTFEKAAKGKVVKSEQWISENNPVMDRELQQVFTPENMKKIIVLRQGGVSDIIKIKDNYYIIKVDKKKDAKQKSFEQVRKQVEFEVQREKKNKAINDYIMETLSQENVTIHEVR